jgi:Zn-dependent protease
MDFAILLTSYIVFVYSTVCHEAAHAWVAHKLGDSTAYLGGQVSLDPIPHIKREPIGMVVAPLLSLFYTRGLIGWASAPLDAMWVARHPRRSAMVAMAGPLANILLCLLAVVVMFIGAKNGVFLPAAGATFHEFVRGAEDTSWMLIAQVVSVVFSLNLLLAILNLMPIPPLDGSNIPLFFLKGNASEQYQNAMRQPWMILITMVLVFKLFPMIFWPTYIQAKIALFRWFFV